MAVTMIDVAREAGVSVATVSNFINHTKSVSADCAARIADAIESLHYVPNQMAKTLKTSVSNNVAIILPNIQDSYYVQIFQGAEHFFSERGFCVNIGITNDLKEIEQKHILNFLEKRCAGFIVVTAQPENCSFFTDNIVSNRIPFVHIDRRINIPDISFLAFNNKRTLEKLTSACLESDRYNIALFVGMPHYSCERDAVDGYREAFEKRGLTVKDSNIIHTILSKEAAFRTSILHFRNNKPDVVITTSKSVTLGVFESLAIIGADDVTVATLGEDNWNRFNGTKNYISTAREAIFMGKEAAEQLYEQIETPDIFEPKTILFEDKYETNVPFQQSSVCTSFTAKTLNIMMLDTLQVDLFTGLIPRFKNISNVDVIIQKFPHQELLERIYSDKGSSDIYMYDMPWLYSLAKDGILADITEHTGNKSIYLKECLNLYGSFNGRYYGLPFMYAPQILFYRKDVFQDKMLQREFSRRYNIKLQPPRSWKEFNVIASYLTRPQNPFSPTMYGTAVPAAYAECLLPEIYIRMRAYGSDIYNSRGKVNFNSHQTLKAYDSLMELLKNGASPNYKSLNDMTVVDEFLSGNIAMLITYPSFISNINDLQRSVQTGQTGFAHIPGKSPIFGGWALGVSARSKNLEDAVRFIQWACGGEMANYSTIMAGQSAIAKVFDNNELISLYPWLPLYKDAYDCAQPVIPPCMDSREIIPQAEIDKILYKWIYKLLSGEITTENAIRQSHEDLAALFDSFGYRQ